MNQKSLVENSMIHLVRLNMVLPRAVVFLVFSDLIQVL